MYVIIRANHRRGTGEIQLTLFGAHQSLNDARKTIKDYANEFCEENFDTHVFDGDTSIELHDEFDNWTKLMIFDSDSDAESEKARYFWHGEHGLLATHGLEGGDDLFYED